MVNVTLKGGDVIKVEAGTTAAEIAAGISMGLFRNACAASINGERVDLRTPIESDCELSILTFDDEDGRWAFRHTASHILAQAVKRLYPAAKLAIGPAIDNGFYYDIDADVTFDNEALEKIEKEMKAIVKDDLKLERKLVSRDDALKYFAGRGEDYKVELIEHLPEGEEIST